MAQRDHRERFHGIVQSAMDAIVSVDADQRIILFNEAAERVFGYSAADIVGEPLGKLIPAPLRAGHVRNVRNFGRTGITSRAMGALRAVHGRHANGADIPLEASISQVTVGGRKVFTAILRDISQKLASQRALDEHMARLRELARALVQARETEQRRISVELHDRVGQSLTALSLNLNAMSALEPVRTGAVAARVGESRTLLQEAIAAVRDLITEMRPLVLDDYGLAAGLRALAKEFMASSGIAVQVDAKDPAGRLAPPVELGLYRIVQEALNNVRKHAEARHVHIRLVPSRTGVELVVDDDGKGFDVVTPRGEGRHWGLLMMRERAEAAGAWLGVESSPGSGTRVTLKLSIRKTETPDGAARP